MHLWMFFSLFFWSLIISPGSLLVHLASVRSLHGLKWSVVCNYPEQKPPAAAEEQPIIMRQELASPSSNWPLTVCLAALKNHQWPFIFKFSLCSSVQLIVNTSQVLKYHVKGQFKTLACSERWPSEVMFEEKIRSLSWAVFDGNSITSSLACQKADTKVPSKSKKCENSFLNMENEWNCDQCYVLYLTFVLWSVFEDCNLEFGPFYNYPFFLWPSPGYVGLCQVRTVAWPFSFVPLSS